MMIPPPSADMAAWHEAIEALPVATRAALAHLFTPSLLNHAAKAERDERIFRLAEGLTGDFVGIAETIHQRLSRYADGSWRYDQDRAEPAHRRNLALYHVLKSCGGKVLSVRTLRRILGDPTVAKQTGGNGHALASRSYGKRRMPE
ncbi:hypothetical protein [Novosphingobium sp. FSW06-99]|uniref:hypothetical protein n=1 Tax=Novosphingobium sp. FSW06-99 TaxID=1739113 RepID=UPI0012E34F5B|nr:hypothetical protein [Novosphingobium sp. FSW06-99]